MKNTIFRQYDIRGIVHEELIIDEVYDLARAIAFYLAERNPGVKTIAVGCGVQVCSLYSDVYRWDCFPGLCIGNDTFNGDPLSKAASG